MRPRQRPVEKRYRMGSFHRSKRIEGMIEKKKWRVEVRSEVPRQHQESDIILLVLWRVFRRKYLDTCGWAPCQNVTCYKYLTFFDFETLYQKNWFWYFFSLAQSWFFVRISDFIRLIQWYIKVRPLPSGIEIRPFFEPKNIAFFKFLLYVDQNGQFSMFFFAI